MYRPAFHNTIYLIPHWVKESLVRHGLKIGDVLNFAKIRPLLSMNDLLSIEALQSFGQDVTGMRRDFGNSILYEWLCTAASDKDKEYIKDQIEPLSQDPFQRDTVKQRLFSEAPASADGQAYEVLPLEDIGLGVVIYPGFFTGSRGNELHLPVLRDILKQLYVYEEHSTVAATPLTLRYLELLSQ